MIGKPVVENNYGLLIVRDDYVPGGTKQAALLKLLPTMVYEEFVFSSPVYGYAQVALALACKELGLKATIFCAARKEAHPLTRRAAEAGAKVVQVPHGRLSVVRARAREYCKQAGALLFPMGFDLPEMRAGFTERALQADVSPKEVWCVAGSGALSRSLQAAWPRAKHFAVRIGFEPDVGEAELLRAPERFEDPAKERPPFPSCANYDAKAWQFIKARARSGALFWNVAS
jgi:hypothetical protein